MLITTRLSFLQQVQKAASNGYKYYTTGTVEIEKLARLIKKFQENYLINLTRQQAYRQRQKGQASSKFYCYADETDLNGTKVFWVLLFTDGKTTATEAEKLKNLKLKKERFEYSDYQLIQKPRADGKQLFTFQLKTDSFNFYQDRIRKAVRNNNISELNNLIIHISKMPGFSALRVQRKKLNSILKGEVKKHLNTTTQEKVSKMTNYAHRQQKVDHVANLSVFIKQLQRNNRKIKNQLGQYRENKKQRGQKSEKPKKETKPLSLIEKIKHLLMKTCIYLS